MGAVNRLIGKQDWKTNLPAADAIITGWETWRKANVDIENDPDILTYIKSQAWNGLAVKDYGGDKKRGVVATKNFTHGSVIADYHGVLRTQSEGLKLQAAIEDENKCFLNFFTGSGGVKLCIDAIAERCPCHPDQQTFGRLFNHSCKKMNMKPVRHTFPIGETGAQDVIIFKAMRNITVGEELLFDYGVRPGQYGEGHECRWLKE